MSFRLRSSLSPTAQTLSLESGGAAQLAATYSFPFYLLGYRTGDGAAEVFRATETTSASNLTIMRAQLGSTALAFTTADTVKYLAVPALFGIKSVTLGSPALGIATSLNAAIPLTNAPQPGVIPSTQPDVARILSVKGNAAGIVGNVVYHGVDIAGNTISETLALAGASEVFTSKAFAGDVTVDLPIETHVGTDTVSLGAGAALGLFDNLTRDTLVNAYLGGAVETTRPSVLTGTTLADCTAELNSALNGTTVIIDYYVD